MSKTSEDIIKGIIEAKDDNQAINSIKAILDAVYLSKSYRGMVVIRDEIKTHHTALKALTKDYDKGVFMAYDDLDKLRFELAFLYRDIADKLSDKVTDHKVFFREGKTIRRGTAMLELKEANEFNASSPSALEKILGTNQSYSTWVDEVAIAAANHEALETLLRSVDLITNAVASRQQKELTILKRDAK